MAIIKCKECGSNISNRAEVCVKCGCPIENSENKRDINLKKDINYSKFFKGYFLHRFKKFFKFIKKYKLLVLLLLAFVAGICLLSSLSIINDDTDKKMETPLECFEYKEVSDGIAITSYNCGGSFIRPYPTYFDEIENKVVKYDLGPHMFTYIPEKINGKPVVEIADNAFYVSCWKNEQYSIKEECNDVKNDTIITEIHFPDTLKRIGVDAFSGNFVEDVVFPDSLELIDVGAFYGNEYVKPIFGTGLKKIGNAAFAHQKIRIDRLTFSDNLEYIGGSVFGNIKSLTLPKSVNYISEYAFDDANIEELIIEDGIKIDTIPQYAFQHNKLKVLNLPDEIKTISDYAFAYNDISEINAPGLEIIGNSALDRNNFTGHYVVPNTVKSLGPWAFAAGFQDESLTSIELGTNIDTIEDYAFIKTKATNLQLSKIINKTGKSFAWEKIILGEKGSSKKFEFGKVSTDSGVVEIVPE